MRRIPDSILSTGSTLPHTPQGRARGQGVLQPRTRFAGDAYTDAALQPKSGDVTQISGDGRLSLLLLARDAEVRSRDNLVNRYRAA